MLIWILIHFECKLIGKPWFRNDTVTGDEQSKSIWHLEFPANVDILLLNDIVVRYNNFKK